MNKAQMAKQYGTVIIMLITAITIIGVSWWTRSEVAWAYILGVGFVLMGVWELLYISKSRGKNQ